VSGDALAVAPPPVPNYGIDSDRLLGRDSLVAALRRRWDGRYAVDVFGGDPHLQDFVLAPAVGRITVEVHGGDRVPASGPALLIANRRWGVAEPIVLAGAVQRVVGRRLRALGMPDPPVVGTLVHKLGGIGRGAGDAGAVLRAGHLATAPLAMRWRGADEAPRDVIAATLGFPLLPVSVRTAGPLGTPLRGWVVSVGEPLAPPEGTAPGDPLAAAELSEAVRAAIEELLTT